MRRLFTTKCFLTFVICIGYCDVKELYAQGASFTPVSALTNVASLSSDGLYLGGSRLGKSAIWSRAGGIVVAPERFGTIRDVTLGGAPLGVAWGLEGPVFPEILFRDATGKFANSTDWNERSGSILSISDGDSSGKAAFVAVGSYADSAVVWKVDPLILNPIGGGVSAMYMGNPGSSRSFVATDVSGNGSSVIAGLSNAQRVGASSREIVIWQDGVDIGLDPSFITQEPMSWVTLSRSGDFAVGSTSTGAYFFDIKARKQITMHSLPASTSAFSVKAVSNNGRAVGKGEGGALFWPTYKSTAVDLHEYLSRHAGMPADFDKWTLTNVAGISGDGRVLAGSGVNPQGNAQAWLATLDSASIVFREKNDDAKDGTWGRIGLDEIPGWDHTGLEFNGQVFESHPGYGAGLYYDPLQHSSVPISSQNGIQSQHSLGSFQHDSASASNTSVNAFVRIPIDNAVGQKMHDAIVNHGPAGFRFINYSSLSSIRETLSPNVQKGGANGNAFTCVGLVEWSAEQAGVNNGQGFIPDNMETIRFADSLGIDPLPTLSPQLLYWVLDGDQAAPATINNWLQGLFDPVDFILTDPLGRRLGHTAALGTLNEIPGAFYSGDGDVEQFFVRNPLAGNYFITFVGIDNSNVYGGFGDQFGGEYINVVLGAGGMRNVTYTVVPEPKVIELWLCAFALVAIRRNGLFSVTTVPH